MAGVKGSKLAARALTGGPRRHHCVKHDAVAKPIQIWPKKRMIFRCDSGCSLSKGQTVLK